MRLGVVGLIVTAASGLPARAVDGVLEINQACVALGCFPGDDPGFPVEIENAGSYRLTSDLILDGLASARIVVTAGDVTIDLNGFTVAGPVTCSGSPVQCTDKGFVGHGIDALSAPGVTVRNGVVRGNVDGVRVGQQGRVEDVRAAHNGRDGISILGGVVENCTAVLNGSRGIYAVDGSLIHGNTASHNGGDGIYLINRGLVSNNVTRLNGGDGIRTNFWVSMIGNTVTENGIGDPGNVGIRSASGGLSIGNSAWFHSGVGLSLGTVGGYAMNVTGSNNGGNTNPQVQGGIELGGNVCGNDTSCP
jgi:hypothetical protein